MHEDLAKNKKDLAGTVEFLDDDSELAEIASIFNKVPWEQGFDGPTGKNYQAIKDFLEWKKFDLETWVPVILTMASKWIEARQNKPK